ncbi:hypothetical protein C3F09_01300 [candidate division GN15 bacterium]|uniref:Uncharacterized protein n=1 Tax=candidate division GN15 bacterium TaxID=2072418 RepID=A0A855X4C9_9BACT|nr:MAG: hypothetical protein C3F09_01300 [candidate division GN15 bacterium]
MSTTKSRAQRKNSVGNPGRILTRLESLRLRFDTASAAEKLRLLRCLHRTAIPSAERLQTCHELLCFLRAYPDNRRILNIVERELRLFGGRVQALIDSTKLTDTGITGTAVEHPFSLELVRLLLQYYRGALEIDWANSDEDDTGNLLGVLPLMVAWQENDIFDNDDNLTAQSFLRRARPKSLHSDLETLVTLLSSADLPPEIQRHLFEQAEIQTRWDLRDSPASRTLARTGSGPLFFQNEPLRPRSKDLRAEILTRPTPLRHLSGRDGLTAVRRINEVLAVRSRELFCVTHANPEEVYLVEPGRGVQIYLFGSKPEVRLPLEANFGAMLVRNGMPIGYGVGACLFDRVEIAINVFPTFRAGESPFIIEQFFKAFYHHFGSRVFVVRSRQMGDGDDEPILAGSFWFYYKLGFRAVRPQIRQLAEREYRRIVQNPSHRSSIAMLRRLSRSDVFFHIDPNQMDSPDELSVANLGYAVTDLIARRYRGDRTAVWYYSTRSLAQTLNLTNVPMWTDAERNGFMRLGPLVAALPALERWSREEKEALGRIIRAKGKPLERQFVLQCNRHPKLKLVLAKLAAKHKGEAGNS